MKIKLLLFSLLCLSLYSCKKEDSGIPSIENQIEGAETLFNVSESNTFSNGDIIGFDDVSQIYSVSQVKTPSAETELLSELRDFYFDFSNLPASFQFSVSVPIPDASGWRLCKFENDVWSELEDATYTETNVAIPMTLTLSSVTTPTKATGRSIFATRIALLKTNSLTSQIEIIKDPYDANPFGALVKFNSAVDVTPTMTLVGQDDNDIVHTFASATTHEIDVLGLYNEHDNTIFIDCVTQVGTVLRNELKIRVDYPFFNSMRVNTSYAHGFKNDPDAIYVVYGNASNFPVGNADVSPFPEETTFLGFDQYGKIRWTRYNKRMDGNLMMGFPTIYNGKNHLFYLSQHSANPFIEILDYNGKTIVEYTDIATVGLGFPHHDAIMIDDHIMAIPDTKFFAGKADNSQIVEFDLRTGTVVRRIDLDDIIDSNRSGVVTGDYAHNPVHINSLAYSSSDDSYVISARHQGVIKIRRTATDKSGLVWWMTPHYGVGDDYKFSLLTPTNFDGAIPENWNLGQHATSILPNGDIMMFDNHNDPIQGADAAKRISRVLVVRVDEANKTVTQINEWTTPQNDFAAYMSNALMLPNGNVLSGWATQKRVYETSYPDGRVLFQADFNPSSSRGDIYRTYKINLYNK